MDWVIGANAMSARILRPDINIFIDIPPETAMQRVNANRNEIERYETIENLKNVRDKYFESFEKLIDQEQILIVEGNLPLEIIADNIWEEVSERFLHP
jgi:dTMP kinase